MIAHYFQSIPGWFDFQDIYASAVARAHDGARFVEVGTFMGKSLAYLAVEIVNSRKDIELFSVDSMGMVQFDPKAEDPEMRRAADYNGQKLSQVLEEALQPCLTHGLSWEHWVGDSAGYADVFPAESLDFVFIDANHDYESVIRDLRAYWPKLRPGATLAGHDHTHEFPGVEQACLEFFGASNYWVSRRSFFTKKPA